VEDEYNSDGRCLLINNIDNDADGGDKIVTGSYLGLLRIWKPRCGEDARGGPAAALPKQTASISPEDLLLEQNLGAPILQLAAGLFSS
jgi:hypothetical protein